MARDGVAVSPELAALIARHAVGDRVDVAAECADLGVPHEVKGEAVICFVVLRPETAPGETLRAELSDLVARHMGKALKPERVLFVADLPKTRSAKIMRRVIRATYLGKDPGDLSSLDNPGAVKAIAESR